jgi:hypothetical protein
VHNARNATPNVMRRVIDSVTPPVHTHRVGIPFDNPAFVTRWRTFVDPETHLWTGYHDKDGYGIFTWPGPNGERLKYRAHRVAWAIANQQQPSGVIRHAISCSTPACCNPDCLTDGTIAENLADRDDPVRRAARNERAALAHGQRRLPGLAS